MQLAHFEIAVNRTKFLINIVLLCSKFFQFKQIAQIYTQISNIPESLSIYLRINMVLTKLFLLRKVILNALFYSIHYQTFRD